jgi:hypothetical protein
MVSPLVALVTSSPNVREVVHNSLCEFYREQKRDEPVHIVHDERDYELVEGWEALVRQGVERAEDARKKHDALIGIAGSHGIVTVRQNLSTILRWRVFMVVGCSASGMIGQGMPAEAQPESLDEKLLDAAVENAILSVAGGGSEPSREISELAGTAIYAWISLQFDSPDIEKLFVQ